MTGFVQGVAEMQAAMAEQGGEGLDYVLASERQREAEQVGGCAARWVEGEMDPYRQLTAARGVSIGPLGAPPSLAEKLGSKFAGAEPGVQDAVAASVHKALAVGYLSYCETEPRGPIEVKPDRSAKDLWEFWLGNCRVMLEDLGIPSKWAKMVRQLGSDVLVGELRQLHMTRFLGGSKLNQLGLLYGQAGVHLRMAQTSTIPDEVFAKGASARRQMPDRPWRYDDYSVAG